VRSSRREFSVLTVEWLRIPEVGPLYLEDLVDIGNAGAALLSQPSQTTSLIVGWGTVSCDVRPPQRGRS